MKLQSLLEQIDYTCLQKDAHTLVTDLVYDSRKVVEGSVFVCIKGAVSDGHDYIGEVVAKGAKAIIVERDIELPDSITVIKVDSTRRALAFMSAAYFSYPAKKLTTIAITGTKGKTTSAYMIKSILDNVGLKTGLIGTIETIIGKEVIPANNTTPESYIIQQTFAKMVEAGVECVVMEVSSQGFLHSRIDGFVFDYGIFTNLGYDHIGEHEHKDFDDYLRCKSMLFKQCKLGLINIDDDYANDIIKDHTCIIETFGFSQKADIYAYNVKLVHEPGYLGIAYQVGGLMDLDVSIDIPGRFNVLNSLCAIAICRHFNVDKSAIINALSNIKVRGRVELVPVKGDYSVMIDYAHNAMSLESLLTTIREYKPKRLVCVFGCGGNRSKDRRFLMGEISSKLADLTVITSDNPRYEEAEDIIKDIVTGVKKGSGKYITITDRGEAIKYCIDNAKDGDIIIIAGKGHENYQEIKGVKYHMDDRELVRAALKL
ncbi:MAG: UDP-N-acetylmuramoyl-L-alanyl-D-glutamate--2,6-diaminopimelate ligase [Clostridiales bacterium]|jgi:UDP-N-acetylmuramoyl-L-alanyl-D-glutamate--2,6-diaminopimelate ligase|nr:UDP-N-acetylmuramoyl-L-alanyl-D-glutamate--2,6-diaminopimelate ligase [Bacillota bacterium]NLK04308.1 UDP-N-acetylmuramoyl-L-alanyl-D-glutamate--2,6-diaminopimelate ligase [Clostridiales bacterium]